MPGFPDDARERLVEENFRALIALHPPGKLWENMVPGGIREKTLRGVAEEWANLGLRARDLIREADPRTANETIVEWEAMVGLPDTCTGTLDQDEPVAFRRDRVVTIIRNRPGGQSTQSIKAHVRLFGYIIEIREHLWGFIAGPSSGDPWKNGSRGRAGDKLENEDGDWPFTLTIIAPIDTVRAFQAGRSVAGEPLSTWGNDALVCLLGKVIPAHTVLRTLYVWCMGPFPRTWTYLDILTFPPAEVKLIEPPLESQWTTFLLKAKAAPPTRPAVQFECGVFEAAGKAQYADLFVRQPMGNSATGSLRLSFYDQGGLSEVTASTATFYWLGGVLTPTAGPGRVEQLDDGWWRVQCYFVSTVFQAGAARFVTVAWPDSGSFSALELLVAGGKVSTEDLGSFPPVLAGNLFGTMLGGSRILGHMIAELAASGTSLGSMVNDHDDTPPPPPSGSIFGTMLGGSLDPGKAVGDGAARGASHGSGHTLALIGPQAGNCGSFPYDDFDGVTGVTDTPTTTAEISTAFAAASYGDIILLKGAHSYSRLSIQRDFDDHASGVGNPIVVISDPTDRALIQYDGVDHSIETDNSGKLFELSHVDLVNFDVSAPNSNDNNGTTFGLDSQNGALSTDAVRQRNVRYIGLVLVGGFDFANGTGRRHKWGKRAWKGADIEWINCTMIGVSGEHLIYTASMFGLVRVSCCYGKWSDRTAFQIVYRVFTSGAGGNEVDIFPPADARAEILDTVFEEVALGEGGFAITFKGHQLTPLRGGTPTSPSKVSRCRVSAGMDPDWVDPTKYVGYQPTGLYVCHLGDRAPDANYEVILEDTRWESGRYKKGKNSVMQIEEVYTHRVHRCTVISWRDPDTAGFGELAIDIQDWGTTQWVMIDSAAGGPFTLLEWDRLNVVVGRVKYGTVTYQTYEQFLVRVDDLCPAHSVITTTDPDNPEPDDPTTLPDIWAWGWAKPDKSGITTTATGPNGKDEVTQVADQSGNGRHWSGGAGSKIPGSRFGVDLGPDDVATFHTLSVNKYGPDNNSGDNVFQNVYTNGSSLTTKECYLSCIIANTRQLGQRQLWYHDDDNYIRWDQQNGDLWVNANGSGERLIGENVLVGGGIALLQIYRKADEIWRVVETRNGVISDRGTNFQMADNLTISGWGDALAGQTSEWDDAHWSMVACSSAMTQGWRNVDRDFWLWHFKTLAAPHLDDGDDVA